MTRVPASPASDISLQEFMDVLRRRKVVILQTFIVIVVVGVLIGVLTKPVYRATTDILVEGKSLAISSYNTDDPVSDVFMPNTGYDVPTQIEVLQSDQVLEDAHKVAGIPFNRLADKNTRLVKLTVKQVADTNVIEITCDSNNPQYAEKLAEALPKTYLHYSTGDRSLEVQNALDFARIRYDQENKKLDQAQEQMERFKKKGNVIDLTLQKGDRISQASAVDADVRKDQEDVAGAKAHLDEIIAQRNALPEFLTTPTTASNTTQIEAQKDKVATLKEDLNQKLILFKPDSAVVKQAQAKVAVEEARLAQIPAMVTTIQKTRNPAIAAYDDKVTDAKAAYATAVATLQESQARAAAVKSGLNDMTGMETRLAKLQREIDQGQANVTMLAKEINDLSLKGVTVHDPVRVITPVQPAEKVAPKLLLNLGISMLLGLLLGVGFAMLQEFLDDRINAPEEARQILGSPALGYVPLVTKEESRLITDVQSGSTLESYRVLRSNVQFATVDGPVSSIMVTSTVPGEGKSVTACNLAVAMAIDGRKVILVDADLRLPTVHDKLGLQQQPGLTNVLLGRKTLDEALQNTSVENLQVLTAGMLPPNPAEILNSLAMRQLHEDLKERADVVIFDSPPCLATADAQVLAAVTDGVLYVLQMGETKRAPVRHSAELLRQAHARILGIVFNKIDLTSSRDNYYYTFDSYYMNKDGKGGYSNGHYRYARAVVDADALVPKNGSASEDHALTHSDEADEEGNLV
jgi:capsular exopolysaccharide synthesis family protein